MSGAQYNPQLSHTHEHRTRPICSFVVDFKGVVQMFTRAGGDIFI